MCNIVSGICMERNEIRDKKVGFLETEIDDKCTLIPERLRKERQRVRQSVVWVRFLKSNIPFVPSEGLQAGRGIASMPLYHFKRFLK